MRSFRRWARWTLGVGLAGVLAILLGALGAMAFLNTQTGRDAVARLAERALSDEQVTVRIAGVGGNPLSDFRLDRVSVADSAGNVILAEDARLVWRPLSLLRGTLDVQSLGVRRISADAFIAAAPPGDDGAAPAVLPPLSVRIGALTVEEIALGPALLGEPQQLSLSASGALDSDLGRVRLAAQLARTDGAAGHAEIDIDYTAAPARFGARLDIEEPDGGPVARLAGLPPGTPLSVTLDGSGPPGSWRGTLTARAGSLADATAQVVLSLRDTGFSVALDGGAAVAPLLPPAARPFALPRIDVRAVLDYGGDGALAVRELEASSAALSVAGHGRYAPADESVEARLSVTVRDAAAAAAVAPGLALDAARLDATIGGTVASPTVDGRVRADGLSFEGLRAAELDGELRLAPAAGGAFAVSGTVRFDGVAAPPALPDGLLGPALDLRIDGTVRPDGAVPDLALRLASGAAAVDIDGAVDRAGRAAGRYALRHEQLAALAGSLGLPLRGGALQADGKFRADLASGKTRMEIAGALSRLDADAPWLAATLGDRVALSAVLQWDGGDTLAVSDLDARSDTARLSGSGVLHPASGRIDARYAVSLAGLDPLSVAAGIPVAGSLSATGAVVGPAGAPRVTSQLILRDLVVHDVPLGSVSAGIGMRAAESGLLATLRLGGALGGKPLGGEVALAVAGETVRVPRLDITVGRNALSGALTVETDGPRLAGSLTATLADFADLPAIAGLPPLGGGSATVRVRLRGGRAQEIAIEADATGLAPTAALEAGGATAEIVVRDAFGALSVDGRIGLTDLRMPGASVGTAALAASGTLAALDWTVSASGEQPAPLSVTAGGRLSFDGGQGTVAVERLQGTLAAHAIALRAPATLAWSPRGLTADRVDLSVDGGGLRLSLSAGAESVDAAAEATDLPLALAGLFEPRFDLAGTVSGRARVRGSPGRPSVELMLLGTDIRPHDMTGVDIAGLEATADLRQGEGELRLRLAVRGPEATTAIAELTTAPGLSVTPLRLAPPPDAPLAGRIEAAGRLDLVERIVGLGGDRLGGRIAANAALSGTVARPELRGEAELTGGAYEGVATGIVVRDATARLVFTGSEARLVSLNATDGGGGRISGSGAIALAGQPAGTGGLSITLDRFEALRRPEADIVASGRLSITGPVHAPAVQGKLTVDRGEMRIPDRLPAGVVELDVIEINGPEEAARPVPSSEGSVSRRLPVALDVTVAFPGRTFLRGRGLDSEWQGTVRVAGTAAQPAITGTLSVVRGSFAFAGKTFALTSGRVSFDGALDPEIEAVAETRLETILARVEIAGKASGPAIEITSEPALPQEEVLARILFGRSAGQLSALQAARLAQSAAALAGTGGAGILDRVRQTLRVDVLDVGEAETGGATLKAGKYLTDDVFVSVTQGTEPGSQKVGVEVEVLPNLSIESDISGQASGNLGVNWKFDY